MNTIKKRNILKESSKNLYLFISFIFAIFPISLLFNCYLSGIRNADQNRNMENMKYVFFFVFIFLMFGMALILMFTLNSYIRENAKKYSLFFVLGIKKKDFWKKIFKEYVLVSMFVGVTSTLLSNFASACLVVIVIEKRRMGLKQFLQEHVIAVWYILAVVTVAIVITSSMLIFHNMRKNLIEFWESLNKNMIVTKTNKMLYFVKPVLGAVIGIVAALCCFQYRTLYLAAILHFISFGCVVSSSECLKWMHQKNRNSSYKHIISSNAVIFQYKLDLS